MIAKGCWLPRQYNLTQQCRPRVIFDRRCGLRLPLDVCFSPTATYYCVASKSLDAQPMATVQCRRPINQDFIDLFGQQGLGLVLHL
jgi:hypothetical protein